MAFGVITFYVMMCVAVLSWIHKMIVQTTNQMQLVMENFKVIVNSFDEAIISRIDNGSIGYCNRHGLNFIQSIYKLNNPNFNEQKLKKYLNKLKSMELTVKRQFNPEKKSQLKKESMESQILRAKIFKVYQSKQEIGKNQQSGQGLSMDFDNIQEQQSQTFSMEDLLGIDDSQWLEDNVFEIIPQVKVEKFTYVQIRKQKVHTLLSENKQLQIVDISQKILYEMAVGERRLMSLINATVSHEMRNPINSMHVQVLEMEQINQKFKQAIDEIPEDQHLIKTRLGDIFSEYQHSVSIQRSGEKILSFLVNDILDYAQINAGNFRKFYLRFNLKECVDEIILILKYKADQLGIKINSSFHGFEEVTRSSLIQDDARMNYQIILDSQRLQQMLLNLVSNATKFTPGGGEVKITCKLIKTVQDLTFQEKCLIEKVQRSKENQKFLEVSVRDTGIGIKEEDQTKLFQLFGYLDTSKEVNTQGIGLGLHITKKIAQIFNGDIICRSRVGEGSNFVFMMALSNEQDRKKNNARILNPQKRVMKKLIFKSELNNIDKIQPYEEDHKSNGSSLSQSSQGMSASKSNTSFDLKKLTMNIMMEKEIKENKYQTNIKQIASKNLSQKQSEKVFYRSVTVQDMNNKFQLYQQNKKTKKNQVSTDIKIIIENQLDEEVMQPEGEMNTQRIQQQQQQQQNTTNQTANQMNLITQIKDQKSQEINTKEQEVSDDKTINMNSSGDECSDEQAQGNKPLFHPVNILKLQEEIDKKEPQDQIQSHQKKEQDQQIQIPAQKPNQSQNLPVQHAKNITTNNRVIIQLSPVNKQGHVIQHTELMDEPQIIQDLQIPHCMGHDGFTNRILIVDDEPYNVLALQLMMSQIGYKKLNNYVERAFNGLQCLEITKEAFKRGHVFSLIFMDCSMPIKDGFETTSAIRQFYRKKGVEQPCIVAITGHTEIDYIQKAWRYEIDEMVPKPLKAEILKEILQGIIE